MSAAHSELCAALFAIVAALPEAIPHVSTTALLAMLRWNDPNGDYPDDMPRGDALACLADQLADSFFVHQRG